MSTSQEQTIIDRTLCWTRRGPLSPVFFTSSIGRHTAGERVFIVLNTNTPLHIIDRGTTAQKRCLSPFHVDHVSRLFHTTFQGFHQFLSCPVFSSNPCSSHANPLKQDPMCSHTRTCVLVSAPQMFFFFQVVITQVITQHKD